MQNNKTIKIFLGSSITELENERLKLADYINNTVAPILENGGWNVHLFKCNDDPSGNFGGSSQIVIDKELSQSDISVFLFKKKAREKTIHEFDLARELQLQEERKHEIYVYCFEVPENEKSLELIAFQQRLKKEEFYWHTCEDIDSLERQFLPGLLKQLFGEKAASIVDQQSDSEKDGDARFKEYKDNEEKQTMLRERLHQDIEELLIQIQITIRDKSINIAVRITKVIELYKKADQWAAVTDYDKEKYSYLLYEYVRFLYDYGIYNDAELVCLRLIPIAEDLHDKDSLYTATIYNSIGLIFHHQANYTKALSYYFKALEIYKKNSPRDADYLIALTFFRIYLVYNEQGDNFMALKYYNKALAIYEIIGSNHSDAVLSHINNYVVHFDQMDCRMALESIMKYNFYKIFGALDELETEVKALGPAPPSLTALIYDLIGINCYYSQDHSKALDCFNKALAIWKEFLGPEHPIIAIDYNNIGADYKKEGDYVNALKYYQMALAIREKILGTEHPDTAQSYNNIGGVYMKQGNYDKALEYYQKALEIWKKALGTEHPFTAASYNNIGSMYYETKEYPKALEYLGKALEIFRDKLGDKHPYTKETIGWIMRTLFAMGENEEAIIRLLPQPFQKIAQKEKQIIKIQ